MQKHIIIILMGLLIGCNTTQQRNSHKFLNETDSPQDSLKKLSVVRQINDKGLEKTASYPYLTIRFKQHDTEVEMMIDPLETNLQLNLKRTPDSSIEINPQDSSEIKTNKPPPVFSDILNKQDKDVTDEILAALNLAQSHFYRGEYSEALQVIQESIKKKPTASAYALGGSIYYVNKELEKAIEAWEIALQINPNMTEIKSILAQVKQ